MASRERIVLLWAAGASVALLAALVTGQGANNDVSSTPPTTQAPAVDNATYCFQYTWVGPTYDIETPVNGTCDDLDYAPPVCVEPLVYTKDGSPPNTTAMWVDSKIRERVRCRLVNNEVCAKWTYSFNGGVVNSTYLCTKITVDGRWPMTSGCETQFKDGYTVEVCACTTSTKGPADQVRPCNSAPSLASPVLALFVVTILLLTNTR